MAVPVIAPVEAFRLSPAGRVPPVTAKVTGAPPPVVATVWLYAWPSTGVGRLAVVMATPAAIVPL